MFKCSNRISLQKLTKELGFKDYRRTLKWLEERKIPYKKEGRGYYILQWHVDFASFLEIAEDLRRRFPTNWFNVFKASTDDEKMVQAVFAVLPPNAVIKAATANNSSYKFFK